MQLHSLALGVQHPPPQGAGVVGYEPQQGGELSRSAARHESVRVTVRSSATGIVEPRCGQSDRASVSAPLARRANTLEDDYRCRAFAPDQIVRLLVTDGYHIHRLVYRAFARNAGRQFLYAPIAVAGTEHVVLVRRSDVETRFAEDQAFEMRLRAMPTVKSGGRRRSIGASRAKDRLRVRWIEARAREHGFTLQAAPQMRVERVRLESARTPWGFTACHYRAPIRLTDPARFTHAYTRGIGQGRAWGCGMVILHEV